MCSSAILFRNRGKTIGVSRKRQRLIDESFRITRPCQYNSVASDTPPYLEPCRRSWRTPGWGEHRCTTRWYMHGRICRAYRWVSRAVEACHAERPAQQRLQTGSAQAVAQKVAQKVGVAERHRREHCQEKDGIVEQTEVVVSGRLAETFALKTAGQLCKDRDWACSRARLLAAAAACSRPTLAT